MQFAISFENRSPFTLKRGELSLGKNTDWSDMPEIIKPYESLYTEITSHKRSDTTGDVYALIPFEVVGQEATVNIVADARHGHIATGGVRVEITPDTRDRHDVLMVCDALEDEKDKTSNTPDNFNVQNYLAYFYSPGSTVYHNEAFHIEDHSGDRYYDSNARINDKGEVEVVFKHPEKLTKLAKQICYFNPMDLKKYPHQGGKKVISKDSIEENATLSTISFPKKYTGEGMQFTVEFWGRGEMTETHSFTLVRATSKKLTVKLLGDQEYASIHRGDYPYGATVQVFKSGRPVNGVPVYCSIDPGSSDLELVESTLTSGSWDTELSEGHAYVKINGAGGNRAGMAVVTATVIDDIGAASSVQFRRMVFENREVQYRHSPVDMTVGQESVSVGFEVLDSAPGSSYYSMAGTPVHFTIDSGTTGLKLASENAKTDGHGKVQVNVVGATAPGTAKVTCSAQYSVRNPGLDVVEITVKPKA
ncbi:hypothetical protein [Enterobacter asburiae]|uniref:hypothetical protein n=1 Tax=Enterobacter asburiae TaxID=61645 RepID=UPI001E48EEF1|nr:hypothetical protein [Enterobacter asburiae]MCE2004196.1 hypothetical protein [Enterobacter asburiae]